jgi:tryptophanyl-tRNA synthetase
MDKPVILTGIRANNDLTIGNYLGALLPIVDMAKQHAGDYQVNLFVPDLHSFTTPIDHSQLHAQIMQNLRIFAAAGLPIDHADVHIYRQSYVPAHSELAWILDCFTGFGEMDKMTQFKDKSGRSSFKEKVREATDELRENNKHWPTMTDAQRRRSVQSVIEIMDEYEKSLENEASVGLFNYPVLMAADVLLYGAAYVPVGEDQTQHLEFMRDIAQRVNEKFIGTFPEGVFKVPLPVAKQHEFFGKDQGLRIRDLVDPTKKMSKSDEKGRGVIFMSDTPEAAGKKIMGAATDSFGDVQFDLKTRPGVTNLLQIQALLSGKTQADVNTQWSGKASYGELKKAVAETVGKFLQEFHAKLSGVDDAHILAKLESSERKMNQIANVTLLRTQQAVGLRAH